MSITARIKAVWQERAGQGAGGLLLFGFTGTLLLCLAAITISFFAAGYFNPYWRRADMDYMMTYQVFLLNDGRPQDFFTHPGYLQIVLLDLWSRLFHGLGALDVIALSKIPPASDVAGFERAWTAAVRTGRLLSLTLMLAFVAAFAVLIRRLIADWRVAALAVVVLAFSTGVMFHARILRTEAVAAALSTLGLLLLLIAARSPRSSWRFLMVGCAALLCTLGVINKVQVVFAAAAWPVVVLAFGVRADERAPLWRHPASAAVVLALLAGLTVLAGIPATRLVASALHAPASGFPMLPPLFGIVGFYQAVLGVYVACAIVAFALIWRLGALETLATLLAVALGVALALLSMTLRPHPQNAVAVVNFLDLMFSWATASDSALSADGGVAIMRALRTLAAGIYEVFAHVTFVLHTSSRTTMFLVWIIVAGLVFAWRRGHRALVGQVTLLLLVAFGLDLTSTFRGAKIEYGVFADFTIIVAAAWLFGNLPPLLAHRYAFPVGALFIALTATFGQFEAVKMAWLSRSGPEGTCSWVGHYVPLIERFPYCPPQAVAPPGITAPGKT
ncbi:MAG: hypothetical protein K2Y71_29010 [Xanthobacteraceae bacterium]|nr:hypothetical protein [Xanthobacteraceae bacterium]